MDTAGTQAHAIELASRERRVAVGGVIAGGRFHATLQRAPYFARGRGSRLWDVDGREFIDFTSSHGAAILGLNDPRVNAAVQKGLELGTLATYETEYHVALAERLAGATHSDRVRLTVTGTEATMAAIRIARAASGRSLVMKFDGHFHGMHDYVFFNAATPARPYEELVPSIADTDGIPPGVGDLVLNVPFNDHDALISALDRYGDQLACVILEPVAFNMGCVPADPEWLQTLRSETTRRGIILIFDEVLSGFRQCFGGAQDFYQIKPDLTTWAKAIGAGMPIAAVTGSASIMDHLNPTGHVIVSGTYAGHLCAVLASLTALEAMAEPGFYGRLNGLTERFCAGIETLMRTSEVVGQVQRFGSIFAIYFGLSSPATDYRAARGLDAAVNERFVQLCHEAGLYFHLFKNRVVPMHYRLSSAHSEADIDEALTRLAPVFEELSRFEALI